VSALSLLHLIPFLIVRSTCHCLCPAGMSFCLPVAYYQEWLEHQQQKEDLEQPTAGVR